jgi:hypothetical protein
LQRREPPQSLLVLQPLHVPDTQYGLTGAHTAIVVASAV